MRDPSSVPGSSISARTNAARPRSGVWSGLAYRLRGVPIRWRILSIAVLNSALALLLLFLIWDGAKVLGGASRALDQVRQSERLLGAIDSDAGRLQSLVHRYFNRPTGEIFMEVERRRESLIGRLLTAAFDDSIANDVQKLTNPTEQLIAGFDRLRTVQASLARTYEAEILGPAKEMSSLYAGLDETAAQAGGAIEPALRRSREAFNAALLAANAYYLTVSPQAGDEARRNAEAVERTARTMLDLAQTDPQRQTLAGLGERAGRLRQGLALLAGEFARRDGLFKDEIDGNAATMSAVIDDMGAAMRTREAQTQGRFDRALQDVYVKVAVVALLFVFIVVVMGVGIARSISEPLRALMRAMHDIVARRYDVRVPGLRARDEIGEMARAVDVFRGNAIAKQRAEEELLAAKERAEATLADLRETQENLIEAEKLAALGGLVAGVAHEVNNPVGISLTVASSLSRRCETFSGELDAGPLRRSRLQEFVAGAKEAADQLVANLQRAGELIQSFKQVAVDRSQAERRHFDLRESAEQILASLRPSLKTRRIELSVDMPAGIVMDSYPGPFGQIVTNLFLNAVTHGFGERAEGAIRVEGRRHGPDHVELIFEDDGRGMSADTQRHAFDPFFTTLRGRGGTGLGLHIVYNLVTLRLGGRIALTSSPGKGTCFRLLLPLVAPREDQVAEPREPVRTVA